MLERACRETDTSRSEERKGEQSPRLIRPIIIILVGRWIVNETELCVG